MGANIKTAGRARGTKAEQKIRNAQANTLTERVASFATGAEVGKVKFLDDEDTNRYHVPGLHMLKGKRGVSFRLRYYDADGKRRVATVGRYPAMSPVEAVEKADGWIENEADPLAIKKREKLEQKAALREQEEAERRARHRTVGEYLAVYERHVTRHRAGREEVSWMRHAFADWLERDMATITADDVERWQQDKEKEGRAHATLVRIFGALKKMFKHAATKGKTPILESNPLEGVTLERKDANSEREQQLKQRREETRRLLTPEEQAGIIAGLWAREDDIRAQPRNRRPHGDGSAFASWFTPFTLMAMATGMRPGDLRALRWTTGLNMRFKRVTFTPKKTDHHDEPATVTMTLRPPLLDYLKAWHKQLGSPEAGLVFPSVHTGKEMDKKAHDKPWRQVKALGGVPDDLTFYSLRHHFIGRMLSDGKSPQHVAELAGHKSTAMIESHYKHLCPQSTDAVLASFLETLPSMGRPQQDEPQAAGGAA